MGKGKTLEMVLFGAGFILMVACGFVYLKSEDTDYKNFAENTKDIKLMNESLTKQIDQLTKNQEAFIKLMTSELDNLKGRNKDAPIAVKLSEPISINLIYREAVKKPLIPTAPKTQHKTGKSLLERAGIKGP